MQKATIRFGRAARDSSVLCFRAQKQSPNYLPLSDGSMLLSLSSQEGVVLFESEGSQDQNVDTFIHMLPLPYAWSS